MLALNQSDLPQQVAAAWPHAFELVLRVAVRGAQPCLDLFTLEHCLQSLAPFAIETRQY